MPTVDTTGMRMVKGVPYEIKGNVAIAYPEGKEPVTVELEMGKSPYSALTRALFSKGRRGPSAGPKTLGNFKWDLNENVLTVTATSDGRVVGTKELLTETELRYPRNHAINIILNSLT